MSKSTKIPKQQFHSILSTCFRRIEKIRADLEVGFHDEDCENKDKCLTEVKSDVLKLYGLLEFLKKLDNG